MLTLCRSWVHKTEECVRYGVRERTNRFTTDLGGSLAWDERLPAQHHVLPRCTEERKKSDEVKCSSDIFSIQNNFIIRPTCFGSWPSAQLEMSQCLNRKNTHNITYTTDKGQRALFIFPSISSSTQICHVVILIDNYKKGELHVKRRAWQKQLSESGHTHQNVHHPILLPTWK